MSTRYVWGRYTIEYVKHVDYDYDYNSVSSGNTIKKIDWSGGAYVADKLVWNGKSFDLEGNIKYWDFHDTGAQEYIGGTQKCMALYRSGNSWGAIAQVSDGTRVVWYYSHSPTVFSASKATRYYYVTSRSYIATERGDLLGYISSSNISAYPNNSSSGSYWYYKLASQQVDATSIEIPGTSIDGGDKVNITISFPSDSINNKYGTLTYTLEYSYSGGSWTQFKQINNPKSNSTFSFEVPNGITSLQIRSQVKDSLQYTSDNYTYSNTITVNNNYPPSAPSSIKVTNIRVDQNAIIAITAATDTDGYIANYYWERSVDGGQYQQIQETNASTLSITDTISANWGTVSYRVRAKDDYGDYGSYITSDVYEVQEGVLTIATPSYNLGEQISSFYFIFRVNATGQTTSNDVSVEIYLDNKLIQSEDTNFSTDIIVPLYPQYLSSKIHSIKVQAHKEGYTTAETTNIFNVTAIEAPTSGIIEQLQNPDKQNVLPVTFGRCVFGRDGKDFNTIIEEVEAAQAKVYSGIYTGTGTYTAASPNSIIVDGTPKMAFIAEVGSNTGLIWGGSPSVGDVSVQSADGDLSWYSTSAASQYNEAGVEYYYMILT